MAVEQAEQVLGPRGVVAGNQGFVETLVALLELLGVDLAAAVAQARHGFVGAAQLRFPAGIAVADGLAQRLGFEQNALVGQVFQVIQRDRADAKAALAFVVDERIGHQQRQRLAQGAGADVVVFLEVLHAQLAAGQQAALDDVGTHGAVGLFDQGARCGILGLGQEMLGGNKSHDGARGLQEGFWELRCRR